VMVRLLIVTKKFIMRLNLLPFKLRQTRITIHWENKMERANKFFDTKL
jgi:hypothetical protein